MDAESSCKVDEVVEQYDLASADPHYDSLNVGLVRRWTGRDDRDSLGYRPLTDWFNRRLLKRVYDEHGRDGLGDRIEHDHRALTSDDDLVRDEVVESLNADGIDGSAVRDAMVSWGTMRTHLQECLGATKEQPTGTSDWERESVAMARSFATEKVESALSSLANNGDVAGADEASVAIRVQLDCDHCPTRVPFDVALERGYVCEEHAATGLNDA